MRMIWTGLALAALSGPVAAQDCRFFNQQGQAVDYHPEAGQIIFDPAYDDAVTCEITRLVAGNTYSADCGSWSAVVTPGMSAPDKPFVDIVVFDGIFFWLKCEETT